jgi:RimJ/RimL family protein N-acetyltransferase
MTETFSHTVEEVERQFQSSKLSEELWLAGDVEGKLVAGADFRRGCRPKSAHVASLGISVRKEFRGLGLGKAMMEVGLEWAREHGIQKVRLGVFATNERAISLYRTLGFKEEGRFGGEAVIDGVTVDEILMAVWLLPPTTQPRTPNPGHGPP